VNLATIIDGHPADDIALVSRGQTTDYGTLRAQVAGLRGGFGALGLEPGDRLAIVAGNNWYFVVSYLAALGAGLVAVPLNPSNPSAALAHELREVGAAAVVSDRRPGRPSRRSIGRPCRRSATSSVPGSAPRTASTSTISRRPSPGRWSTVSPRTPPS